MFQITVASKPWERRYGVCIVRCSLVFKARSDSPIIRIKIVDVILQVFLFGHWRSESSCWNLKGPSCAHFGHNLELNFSNLQKECSIPVRFLSCFLFDPTLEVSIRPSLLLQRPQREEVKLLSNYQNYTRSNLEKKCPARGHHRNASVLASPTHTTHLITLIV